jgi:hypothetical protein
VPEAKWTNRDSAAAVRQLGDCLALLRAGCDFTIRTHENSRSGDPCVTDARTIWVDITFRGFAAFEHDGPLENETYYIPTQERIDAAGGGDWY